MPANSTLTSLTERLANPSSPAQTICKTQLTDHESLESLNLDSHSQLTQPIDSSREVEAKQAKAADRWIQVNRTMSPALVSTTSARFELRAAASTTGTSGTERGLTVVPLFPQHTAGLLDESRPAFIRLPGGCSVESKALQNRSRLLLRSLHPLAQ